MYLLCVGSSVTLFAGTTKLELMRARDMTVGKSYAFLEGGVDVHFEIKDALASFAEEVIVVVQTSVEPIEIAKTLEFPDFSPFGQDFQISIHRSQADFPDLSFHRLIDIVSGRMGCACLHELEYAVPSAAAIISLQPSPRFSFYR
jgi:hypothetical protein